MKAVLTRITFICALSWLFAMVSCDIPVDSSQSVSKNEWATFFNKNHITIQISNTRISCLTSSPDTNIVNVLSLDWPIEDSSLMNDTQWNKSGDWAYANNGSNYSFPKQLYLKFRVNGINYLDTILLSNSYISSTQVNKDTLDSNDYYITAKWNHNLLSASPFNFMSIMVDNGLIGAKYYHSYPNYNDFSESPQFPDGHIDLYDQFSPANDSFAVHIINYDFIMPIILTDVAFKIKDDYAIITEYDVF